MVLCIFIKILFKLVKGKRNIVLNSSFSAIEGHFKCKLYWGLGPCRSNGCKDRITLHWRPQWEPPTKNSVQFPPPPNRRHSKPPNIHPKNPSNITDKLKELFSVNFRKFLQKKFSFPVLLCVTICLNHFLCNIYIKKN